MIEAKYPYYPTIYRNINPYSSTPRYHANSVRPLYATLPYIKSSHPTLSSLRTTSTTSSPPSTTIMETETSVSSNKPFDEVITAMGEVGNEIVVQSSLSIEVENKTRICKDGKTLQGGSCKESILHNESNHDTHTKEITESIDDGQSKNHNFRNENEIIQDDNKAEETTQENKSVVVEDNVDLMI